MTQSAPVLTGDPRTDRAFLTLARLLVEIAANPSAPDRGVARAAPTVPPPTARHRRGAASTAAQTDDMKGVTR